MTSPSEIIPPQEPKKNRVLQLQIKPGDPLILDRWVDVAYVGLWFSFGLWGVITLLVGLPTITQFTPDWYQTAWSGSIGLLAITASIVSSLIFFDTPWMKQYTKKYIERALAIPLCAFIGVYPVLLILRTLDGDAYKTAGLSALILGFVIFPALRIHILNVRIKAIREVEKVATGTSKTI